MRLRAPALATIALVLATTALPRLARAGGPEFPGGGTRSLGRGGAAFARADDPSLMFRNPALLADLWDDQAMLGAHFLLEDACMQPTGAYGWSVATPDVSDFGDGPIYLQAQPGDRDLNGKQLVGYGDEPFPKVCSQGAMPFLPQVGLSMKVGDDVGVGIGFFPPDNAALNQWGDRDGTIDTPKGRRPNPLRYYDSHLNTTFFSILSAVGYRPADWISIGVGFQWNMVIYGASAWTTSHTARDPREDVRADVFGRDLFIPGLIASLQLRPFDGLDIAAGFKWSDRITGKAKLDLTSGVFGIGKVFEYQDAMGTMKSIGSTIPTTSPNQPASVDAPPIWVPQATFALRYAQRIKPKPTDTKEGHLAAAGEVEDHMLNERWDLEADGTYYFTSVYDHQLVSSSVDTASVTLSSIDAFGNAGSFTPSLGKCKLNPTTKQCVSSLRVVDKLFKGKDQLSLRFGGDYNLFPGLFAIRGGVSYETDGQDPAWLNVMRYMFGRIGVHGGVTLRVAHKTDISFGFAHFIQKKIRLQVNGEHSTTMYPPKYRTAQYHFKPGLGIPTDNTSKAGFDGVTGVEVPNGDPGRAEAGPEFIGAGTFYYNLDVASLTFTQHF